MRTSSAAEVMIELDRSRPRGLRAQIEDGLRLAIRDGRLVAGAGLPSTRALADDLGVTRGVVVGAYDQLLAEGYLTARPGSGTVVSEARSRTSSRSRTTPNAEQVLVDFRTAYPDLSLFPRAAWLRATRTAFQTLPDEHLGYSDPRGLPVLRDALADYLGRVRGVDASAEQIVVTNGFGHALSLLSRVLQDAGHDSAAAEDPGHYAPGNELRWLGFRVRSVAVDDDGIVVEPLRRSQARVVLVTPAHQFPTGAVLASTRRHALAAWARAVDGYVIEDDYDAEYRYDRQPVGALQGIAPDRVIYSGTASKSLAPGLRLGWLVVPSGLVDALATARKQTDHATPAPMQATYAAFLANGDLDRHLRRTRRVYRQRRDALLGALERWLPDVTPSGIAAGLHLLATLPDGLDETVVADSAAARGVRVYPLGRYRASRRADERPALVLGYGNLRSESIERGIELLARAIG
jgi:GntR family transcriptional regulator / MocR family aminotransferase